MAGSIGRPQLAVETATQHSPHWPDGGAGRWNRSSTGSNNNNLTTQTCQSCSCRCLIETKEAKRVNVSLFLFKSELRLPLNHMVIFLPSFTSTVPLSAAKNLTQRSNRLISTSYRIVRQAAAPTLRPAYVTRPLPPPPLAPPLPAFAPSSQPSGPRQATLDHRLWHTISGFTRARANLSEVGPSAFFQVRASPSLVAVISGNGQHSPVCANSTLL